MHTITKRTPGRRPGRTPAILHVVGPSGNLTG